MSTYPSGVYKDNDTQIPDYSGCSDSIEVSESFTVINERLANSVQSYSPEIMKDSDYSSISEILEKQISQIDGNSNLVSDCYNTDMYDDELIYKLYSLSDIDYPLDYKSDQLLLLIKVYPKIRKMRGQEKAIRALLRVLGRSEADLYQNDSDDTQITVYHDNNSDMYQIHNSRLNNSDPKFILYMLSKIIPAGTEFSFNGYSRIGG